VADTGVDYRSVGNTEESVFVSNWCSPQVDWPLLSTTRWEGKGLKLWLPVSHSEIIFEFESSFHWRNLDELLWSSLIFVAEKGGRRNGFGDHKQMIINLG
jgi:hypothetical protein